jgi:acetolactate synthase-1/2/3 large subunit
MKAVEWFVQELRQRGVDWMATLCGHGLDPLFQAAKQAGMRLVDTRNEQTAGYIADYCGRLTRKPGVCAVSSGVAHVNAMTGVVNAFFDGSPMLLISGAGALRTAGMGHFQDMDQVALATSVTRYARVIDCADRAVQILDEALRAAVSWPPGPVHLTYPMDIQTTEVEQSGLLAPTPRGDGTSSMFEDPDEVGRALAQAGQPLIIAGSGMHYSCRGEQLLQFSERYSIPVVVPIWDRGCVGRPAGTFLGVIGAASGGPRLLPDADCIVMAGAEPDYRVGFLQPGAVRRDATVLYLQRSWEELERAYARHGGTNHAAWLGEARRRQEEFRQSVMQAGLRQAAQGTHAIHILSALQEVITERTLLLIDGGSIGQWAHQLLCDRYPGHWLTCGRSGVVGWGIGGAMAARLAHPDRPIILLSGDGAFTFNVAELECAVRQSLPFVAIVADDQGWGITRTGHIRQFGEPISSSLGPIAIDRLAESLGARGIRVERGDDIPAALRRALAEPAVTVLHVPVVGGNPS